MSTPTERISVNLQHNMVKALQPLWGLLDETPRPEDWRAAIQKTAKYLTGLPLEIYNAELTDIVSDILSERQFGGGHFSLSKFQQFYYQVRPLFPSRFRLLVHKAASKKQAKRTLLRWPIEDRYAVFQFQLIRAYMDYGQRTTLHYIHFWPHTKRFAFVLTHDVESARGIPFVREVMALEEQYGFRSAFNFVPEDYRVDEKLLGDLRKRGFEIGVHGLKHDGKLFSSRSSFLKQAARINQYVRDWEAAGFRSPSTLRNPEWMQALQIEYDSSFFDTDPYEPIPGGTMSIWPFQLGHFIELPYTLAQDHTLMVTLGEKTPRLWLDKVNFIQRYCGMALVNSHPDYLMQSNHFSIYEHFLKEMCARGDFWHALPRQVAGWWRERDRFIANNKLGMSENMPDSLSVASVGQILCSGESIELIPSLN